MSTTVKKKRPTPSEWTLLRRRLARTKGIGFRWWVLVEAFRNYLTRRLDARELKYFEDAYIKNAKREKLL